MRVIIVGSGRSETTTVAQSCAHITNLTSGHETQGSVERSAGAFDVKHDAGAATI